MLPICDPINNDTRFMLQHKSLNRRWISLHVFECEKWIKRQGLLERKLADLYRQKFAEHDARVAAKNQTNVATTTTDEPILHRDRQ